MMKSCGRTRVALFLVALATPAAFAAVACDNSSTVHETVTDGGGNGQDTGSQASDSGGEASTGPDCVTNPKTHEEIINACTDAAKIDKHPVLPNLLPDGGLPPLK